MSLLELEDWACCSTAQSMMFLYCRSWSVICVET